MKLHLGSGDLRFLGWVNLDLTRGHDLSRGLPDWPDGAAEAVYTCHFLEHLSHAKGAALLREVHRVLQPGGIVRIGVPDVRLFARAYLEDDRAFAERYFRRYCDGLGPELDPDGELRALRRLGPLGALAAIVYGWGHRAIYDAEALGTALVQAGFPAASVQHCNFGESYYFGRCELDQRYEDHSVFVEAEKPLRDGDAERA